MYKIIMDAKFFIPNEDTSRESHSLFRDCNPNGTSIFNWVKEHWYYTHGDCHNYMLAIEHDVSFMYMYPLAVPRLMLYTLINKEDNIKVGFLKYNGGFRQEGIYGVNIICLRLGFIHEDAPINEVPIVLNIFRNELVKTNAQYPNRDTRFSSWIKLTDT
ncbi:uncharacterized protein A4U43_C04F28440 [Asparagus officinalis]|uniref:Uncharacterized protein n=1 Tax=Asparagus officinalis TaxID=4686 RepID=A0A5P1F975_ASPOF|nr:uncharacterized protein A4U43_C04F28440 [Asparagus officinalis]